MANSSSTFTFADLFAGIGGFHAALEGLGGTCVYAAEKDRFAAAVYRKAWPKGKDAPFRFVGDINEDVPPLDDVATIEELALRAECGSGTIPNVPEFDVLAAGFPCQAFSKSGHQLGVLDETRGTLFYNILRIVAERKPKIVMLENVKNLVGPRHRQTTFRTIIGALKTLGYIVNESPTIVSPHQLPPEMGGGPQFRERVYIMGIRADLAWSKLPFPGFTFPPDWDAKHPDRGWRIAETQLSDGAPAAITERWLSTLDHTSAAVWRARRGLEIERHSVQGAAWLELWGRLLDEVVRHRKLSGKSGPSFPGFPIWFAVGDQLWLTQERNDASVRDRPWKHDILDKSLRFLGDYEREIDEAGVRDLILALPNNSWKKLEWQAGAATSLSECLIQLRPSGVRVKKATYAPALVAINQTPILGSELRRLTPYEAGRLQGFPDAVYGAMCALGEPEGQMYKQFGNAVHVGVVRYALTQFIKHHYGSCAPADEGVRALWLKCSRESAWGLIPGGD